MPRESADAPPSPNASPISPRVCFSYKLYKIKSQNSRKMDIYGKGIINGITKIINELS